MPPPGTLAGGIRTGGNCGLPVERSGFLSGGLGIDLVGAAVGGAGALFTVTLTAGRVLGGGGGRRCGGVGVGFLVGAGARDGGIAGLLGVFELLVMEDITLVGFEGLAGGLGAP